MTKLKYKQLGIVLIFVLVIITLEYFLSSAATDIKNTNQETVLSSKTQYFPTTQVVAQSAIVWDVTNQKAIFAKNAKQALPLASITKIMAALTVIDLIPYNTVITINTEAILSEGESGLFPNEHWKLKDLLDFSLIESSNDGMSAIASLAGAIAEGTPSARTKGRSSFIVHMNNKAYELGLSNMSFLNESGLDIYNETEASAVGSAEDVAKMFDYTLTYHKDILEPTAQKEYTVTSLDGHTHIAKNTNKVLNEIPGIIGSKTGYTDIAGGNLAVVIDPGINQPFIIVVLGSTFEERFSDVVTLAEATLQYLQSSEK